jgi:hypothetical protein
LFFNKTEQKANYPQVNWGKVENLLGIDWGKKDWGKTSPFNCFPSKLFQPLVHIRLAAAGANSGVFNKINTT